MSSPAAAPAITGRTYLGLIGLGATIGIPASLLAAVFLAFVHVCEDWLWTDLPDALGESRPPWYLLIGLPMIGAVVVWAARRLLPGDGGHPPLNGLSATPTPWQYGPGVALAAIGTLAFGAVLGPEAPLIALGSVVGMAVTPFVRLNKPAQQVLATAGSFSAVSALFGGPLVAGMLLLEAGVAAGASLIPALLPGLVAAAIGYTLFVGLGDWGGLEQTALTIPGLPDYSGTHLLDLLLAIIVGVFAAIAMVPVRRIGVRVDDIARIGPKNRMLWLLLGGGAAVGTLALLARALGADSQNVLFSGQAAIPDLVTEDSLKIVLVLLVAKLIGYAVSLGSGFRGGPVFPAIFIGIGLATVCVIVFDVSPTWAVAVGTAAGMTAGIGLIFSSLLFSLLLVGSVGYDALPAAVLAAAAAWLTRTALSRRAESDTRGREASA